MVDGQMMIDRKMIDDRQVGRQKDNRQKIDKAHFRGKITNIGKFQKFTTLLKSLYHSFMQEINQFKISRIYMKMNFPLYYDNLINYSNFQIRIS